MSDELADKEARDRFFQIFLVLLEHKIHVEKSRGSIGDYVFSSEEINSLCDAARCLSIYAIGRSEELAYIMEVTLNASCSYLEELTSNS